jgi:hypothetical protein
MANVTILCPRTGERVPTGLDIDEEAFQGLRPIVSRMKCPACGSEHVWSKANAELSSSSLPPRRRPPSLEVEEAPPPTAPEPVPVPAPAPITMSNAARRAMSIGSKFGHL